MHLAHLVVGAVVVGCNLFSAAVDFARYRPVLDSMTKAGVPHPWLPRSGTLEAAGALGVLVGLLGVPVIGAAAGVGIVLFFAGAIITRLRAGDRDFGLAAAFLLRGPAAPVLERLS